jgi:colanic acid/amylovoran biosynthesis glycosyltransferase
MSPPDAPSPSPRIGYLVNSYPMVSLAFIRREILALEARGVRVTRFSLRHWDGKLVDAADLEEARRTRYVLDQGPHGLAAAVARVAACSPRRFARALRTAIRISGRTGRGLAYAMAYLAEAAVLVRWCAEAGIEHLHAHFSTNPAAVALLAHTLGGPRYSFTVHGPTELDTVDPPGLRVKIRHAAFVAGISSFTRSQLYRFADLTDWSKIRIVHCGVDDRYLGPPPPYDASSQTLLCIGRFSEQKGYPLLVQAFAEVALGRPDARLVLAGDGELRAAIERQLVDLGLTGRVEITGYLDSAQVYQRLVQARALVLPSFAEGLPVVIMEAFALGRPVISTYIAGIPELVEPGRNGWLVPAGALDELVTAMTDCLTAPAERLAAMGQHGRALVLERHQAGREAARLLQYMQGQDLDIEAVPQH